ncbi:acyl-CoA synthetase [Duganella sp. FT3S]|uniref:Acyl-CoA synthetase n=1 Tax=Rugamonas fusca TaxID=2758568 RepID=A0A7W2EJ95_9BURK|nr:acyl-CoA synthetase [Rugamonas fusca]MBA5606760.1 acyl-CoA synthetase [Rugamonas fusca]
MTEAITSGASQAAYTGTVRRMADVLALEQTPWMDKLPAASTYALLMQACARHPQRCALRFVMSADPAAPECVVSYANLARRVTQAANAFHRAGIVHGKAVTLLLPNLPQTHYALLGAQAAGIASPVNPMLEVEHIAAIVAETGAEALVALAPLPGTDIWDKAMAVVERCPTIRTVYAVRADGYLDAAARPMLQALFERAPRPGREDVAVLDFDAALNDQPDRALVSGRVIAATDVCSYFHTGGTTGLPKVAAHTHLNETFVAWALAAWTPGDAVLLCGLPLFHVNGAMVTGLAAFHAGAEVVLLTPAGYRGKDVLANFWRLVERFRATSFSAVPTIYATLADVPHAGIDISSLRYAICGAAALPADVARRFEAATGVRLYEGYGLTEGACVSACNPPEGERRLGTVGLRLPYQQLQAWRVDAAGQAIAPCGQGEVGVIGICGPNVFPGYLREADNGGIWLKPGWLNTGDLGFIDADGYLHLTGRAKELIIRGGHNIDPAMIEDALLRHPAVAMVAAVGQPDAHAGELPVAYVTLKPGATASAEALLAAARELVPERAAVPVRVVILDQMALTAVGKVAKAALRLQAAEHVFQRLLAAAQLPATVRGRADLQRGMVLEVACAADDAARVRALLGQFSVPFDVVSRD